jgi:glutathione S-transferase
VSEAEQRLQTAYAMIERHMADRKWAAGDAFSLADCAAAPALFFAGIIVPFGADQVALNGYFERLLERPSFARVLSEARPFFDYFPFRDRMPKRFLDIIPA